jgi:hypothetical protein
VTSPVVDHGATGIWWVPQPADSAVRQPTYLVDGDCGFCMAGMRRVLRAFPGTFIAVPYRTAPLGALGLTLAECQERGHFLEPHGDRVRIMAGGQSWAGILQQQSGVWLRLGEALSREPLRTVTEQVYRWVAANRGTLSRVLRLT